MNTAKLQKGREECPKCKKKGVGYAGHAHAFGWKDYGKARCRYCNARFVLSVPNTGITHDDTTMRNTTATIKSANWLLVGTTEVIGTISDFRKDARRKGDLGSALYSSNKGWSERRIMTLSEARRIGIAA